ncbi:MAG: cysteine desulfurase family protein [Vicinamibacterales bacterium]
MSPQPIYLDHHATTPVDRRVLDAMMPYFSVRFGNAGSRQHAYGWEANEAVEEARHEVAALIGASAREIVFTSGATESNNLALEGATETRRSRGDHVVTVQTEHHSVLDVCKRLETHGWRVTRLPVGAEGLVDLGQLREAVTSRTVLVSVMAANNEIGVLHQMADIATIAHEHGALLHSDIVQAAGKVAVDVQSDDIDLASFTAHKLYGPKGVGALFVRRRQPRISLIPLFHGGGQERGLRPGTLNVPGIVGFGAACAIAARELREEASRLTRLRDRLLASLQDRVDGLVVNGSLAHRLPGNLNVSFAHVDGEALLVSLTDVAVSSGAACTAAEPSHVLKALGRSTDVALASLRFGLGRWTTEAEVDAAATHVAAAVTRLRAMAPV